MRRFQSRALPVVVAATCLKQRLGSPGFRFSANAASTNTGDTTETGNVLPGLDLAKRVADPTAAFPATWSADEPLAPSDPRVMWKEDYSLAEERPYYHNVRTNETTHEIPDGFVTRFPHLYRRQGFTLDEHGAVLRSGEAPAEAGAEANTSAATGTTLGKGNKLTTKQKLAAYGGGGLLWYLIVHNVCLSTIFSLLYFFKVDLVAVARSYGFNVPVKRSEEVEEISGNKRRNPPFFKTFVLAVVLNKLLVPIQLFFTVATAPLLVHRLEPVAAVLLPKCKAFFHQLKLKIKGGAA